MNKWTAIVLLALGLLVTPPVMLFLSSLGDVVDLRVYEGPDGKASLRVQAYVPTFDLFDTARHWVQIDRGGWEYPVYFSIPERGRNEWDAWLEQCSVEWQETEVIFKTPAGYSIHLTKDYAP